MKNAWLWNPAVQQRVEPLPVRSAALTAATDYERPQLTQPMTKHRQPIQVARDGVVLEIAHDDLFQSFADQRNRFVHPTTKFGFDLP
jgi:hypothetical protein